MQDILKAGLSKKQLTEKVKELEQTWKIDRSTVYRKLKGTTGMTIPELQDVAHLFNKDIDLLVKAYTEAINADKVASA